MRHSLGSRATCQPSDRALAPDGHTSDIEAESVDAHWEAARSVIEKLEEIRLVIRPHGLVIHVDLRRTVRADPRMIVWSLRQTSARSPEDTGGIVAITEQPACDGVGSVSNIQGIVYTTEPPERL